MDILVTGGGGQVGIELQRLGTDRVRFVAPSRQELDLAQPESIARLLGNRPWTAVINAAAYTAVDRAEADVAHAWSANALGPAVLAAETGRARIPLVQVSTDYVFSGEKIGAYEEDDSVEPLGVYGGSKLGGEVAVRTGNPRHAIVRTSWVVSAHRANFVRTMMRLAAERPVLRVVDDQHGCPTSAADLAGALRAVALGLVEDPEKAGTYHFANAGATTWCGFAREILAQSQARGGPCAEVEAITTAEFLTPARRPRNSRLSTAKIESAFGIVPRRWEAALIGIMDELIPTTGA